MTPAIDQMIAYLKGEMAKYATPAGYMDKGYRSLEQARKQAQKIKERCDADDAAHHEFVNTDWRDSVKADLS